MLSEFKDIILAHKNLVQLELSVFIVYPGQFSSIITST